MSSPDLLPLGPRPTRKELRDYCKAQNFAPIHELDFNRPRYLQYSKAILADHATAIRFAVNAVKVPVAVTGPRLVFYTDGSHPLDEVIAGAGVAAQYFFPGAPVGWDELVYGLQTDRPTKAELAAVYCALTLALEMVQRLSRESWAPHIDTSTNSNRGSDTTWLRVMIISDSQDVLDAVSNYLSGTIDKVKGRCGVPFDEIETLLSPIRQLEKYQVFPELHWCAGHIGIAGNEKADRLAKKGLNMMKSKQSIPTTPTEQSNGDRHGYGGDHDHQRPNYQLHTPCQDQESRMNHGHHQEYSKKQCINHNDADQGRYTKGSPGANYQPRNSYQDNGHHHQYNNNYYTDHNETGKGWYTNGAQVGNNQLHTSRQYHNHHESKGHQQQYKNNQHINHNESAEVRYTRGPVVTNYQHPTPHQYPNHHINPNQPDEGRYTNGAGVPNYYHPTHRQYPNNYKGNGHQQQYNNNQYTNNPNEPDESRHSQVQTKQGVKKTKKTKKKQRDYKRSLRHTSDSSSSPPMVASDEPELRAPQLVSNNRMSDTMFHRRR